MKIRVKNASVFRELVQSALVKPDYYGNFLTVGSIAGCQIYIVKDACDIMEEGYGAREYEPWFKITDFYFMDIGNEIVFLPFQTADNDMQALGYFRSSDANMSIKMRSRIDCLKDKENTYEDYIVNYVNEALRDYGLEVELVDEIKRKQKVKENALHAELTIQI